MTGQLPPAADDRVALVTGASGGIGGAVAAELARRVGHVVLHHAPGEDGVADERAARINASDRGRASTAEADLRDRPATAQLIEGAIAERGRLDVLVNSAGVMREHPPPDEALDDWDTTIAVNLTATFQTCRLAAQHMAGRGGVIINLASQLAFKGAAGLVAYAASKAGVVGLTRSLAREVGPTVRVYALAPGPVQTPMIAPYADDAWRRERAESLITGRIAEPQDVARVAASLLDDSAGLLLGQTLHCNGGGVLA